jgi:iron complex outermembrane recepter protein
VISTLDEQIIIESPDQYNSTYIERDADGFISDVVLRNENQGRPKTAGLDFGATWRGDATPLGRFGASPNATLVLQYDRQLGPQKACRSSLGVFLNGQVVQRWRHRVSLAWSHRPLGLSLANQFSSGYTDQNTTYDPITDERLPARQVKAY